MTVALAETRPDGHRSVPLLVEPSLGHYPEFAAALAGLFDLATDPFRPAPIAIVDGRYYEFVFTGRSGRVFPAGLEVNALVEGLEPMDVEQADRDLMVIVAWLLELVGPPWTLEGLRLTAGVYRVATVDSIPADAP